MNKIVVAMIKNWSNFGFQLFNIGLQALNLGFEVNGENNVDICNNLDFIQLEFEKIKNKIQNNGKINSFGGMENYQQKKYDLTLIFESPYSEIKTVVSCCFDDKISDIIKAYRIKSGDKNENEKFIYNAKTLKMGYTVRESGLSHNGNIIVSPFGI